MMAFILQYIVAKRGRKNKETEIQMKRLVAADDQLQRPAGHLAATA